MIQRYKTIQVSIFLFAFYLIQVPSAATPLSFGIILNHDKEGDIFAIQSYIDRLNNPQCDGISEINIISSESYENDVKKMNQRVSISTPIPIYLAFINEDNIFSKFIIPKDSQSELFYIGNILSKQSCEQIKKQIEKAAQYMVGGLIPIIGQQNEQSVITLDNTVKLQIEVFNYDKNEAYRLFQIVQNIRIISRHTVELAKSEITEVALMSKEVSPACEEIFMNFIASHFYPEIKNRYFSFQNKLVTDKSQKLMSEKNSCVKKLISILGYCPLYYQNKLFNSTLWKNPQQEKVVELKKVDLMGKLAQLQDSQRRFLQTMKIQPEYNLSVDKSVISFLLLIIICLIITIIFFLRIRLKFLKSRLQQLQQKGCSN